jgi:hypothetical protein
MEGRVARDADISYVRLQLCRFDLTHSYPVTSTPSLTPAFLPLQSSFPPFLPPSSLPLRVSA